MKQFGWILVGVLGAMSLRSATAADAEALYRLTHPRSCPGCDLSQAELPDGIDLSGYDLSRTRFNGARLRSANLQGADFAGADLSGADVSGANLRAAKLATTALVGVDFSRAQTDADFSSIDLTRARFKGSELNGNRFNRAQLVDADLSESKLVGVDFGKVVAPRVNFSASRIENTHFVGAVLSSASFKDLQVPNYNVGKPIDFSGADLNGADFNGANCRGKSFRICTRTDAATTCPAGNKGPCLDFVSALVARNRETLHSTSECKGCDLRGATLDNKGGPRIVLDGADLRYASLYRFNAPDGSFVDAKLQGADIVGDYTRAKMHGADLRADRLMGTFVEAQLQGADLSGADIQMSDYRRANLIKAKLNNALVYGTDLRGADLTGADVQGLRYGNTAKTDATTTCPDGKPGPCAW